MPGKIKSRSTKPAGRKKSVSQTANRSPQTAQKSPASQPALPQNTIDRAMNGNGYNLNPADILALQQTHGNQAVQRLMRNNGRNGSGNSGSANSPVPSASPAIGEEAGFNAAPVQATVKQPLIQRGKSKEEKEKIDADTEGALKYFKKLKKKPSFLGLGTTKKKRRKLALAYHQKQLKAAQDKEEDQKTYSMKFGRKRDRELVDQRIRQAYRAVFNEELPLDQEKSLLQAQASTGNLKVGQPDYANPALIGQDPDQYKITLVSSLEKINWNKMFSTLKNYHIFRGYSDLKALLNEDYRKLIKQYKEDISHAGHVWVRLSTFVNGKLRDLYSYGFYSRQFHDPATGELEGGYDKLGAPVPGFVQHPDTTHEKDPKKGVKDYDIPPAKREKHERALDKAQEIFKSPPPYVAIAYNCASFARDVVKAAGFNYPIKGIGPKYLTPGRLIKKLEEVKKDDKDPLQKRIKGIDERKRERQGRGIKKLTVERAREGLLADLADLGLITEEKGANLSLEDLKVLRAFKAFRGEGGKLLGQLKKATTYRFAFEKLQKEFEEATDNVRPLFKQGRDWGNVPLNTLNKISSGGSAFIGTFLGISAKELIELKSELGLRLPGWKKGDKERIGVSAGIKKEELGELSVLDVKTINRFKRLKVPLIKGKQVDPQDIVRRYKKAGYKEKELIETTKLSRPAKARVAKLLGVKQGDIDWFFHEVKIKAGVTKSGIFRIPGDKSNKVTVYDSHTFKPITSISGGDRIDVLDSAHKSDEFITIRYVSEQTKGKVEGAILGAHIYKRPTQKSKTIEVIKQKQKAKKQAPPKKPFLTADLLKGLHNIGYELEKYDPLHREPDQLSQCWVRWPKSEAYQTWQTTKEFESWQKEQKGQLPPPKAFFDYVSDLEANFDDHLVASVRLRLLKQLFNEGEMEDREMNAARWLEIRKAKGLPLIPRITYLEAGKGPKGRDQHRLIFSGSSVKFADNRPVTNEKHIYVMTAGNEFYAKKETSATQIAFHHTSFLQGEEVGAAGTIKTESEGVTLDLESGHYHPSLQHMINALKGIQAQGASLEAFRARPFMKPKWPFNAAMLMRLIEIARTTPEKTLDKMAALNDKKLMKRFKKLGLVDDISYRFRHFLKTDVREMVKKLKL